ncbi:MAG: hypothetical protein ACLVJH_03105 [Faecalibacterium prausnitzii]
MRTVVHPATRCTPWQPTNIQPVTRYFSQQDKMRHELQPVLHIGQCAGLQDRAIPTSPGTAMSVCAEQNGVRLICVTMQSQLSTDKYNDVRTLLDYAFATLYRLHRPARPGHGHRTAGSGGRRQERWAP